MNYFISLGSPVTLRSKAGNLNKLFGKFTIARGFIITDEYYQLFLEQNEISLDGKYSDVEYAIKKGKFPYEEELLTYFDKYNFKNVIIRSSASVEDGREHSFAGQFESFTNVSRDGFLETIKKCWISSQKENVKAYIKEKKIASDFKFDVLVQEMIDSDVSGLAFTINPTNGEKGILIEANRSSCEDIVNGFTKTHIYNRTYCKGEILSKEQFDIIENTLKELKDIFKREIEIEFGFMDDKMYLFQVRYITSIYYSVYSHIEDVYWCAFKNNNWTLFNRSLWILGATKYKNKNVKNEVTEDVTLYLPHNKAQIRGFNGGEPPLNEETIQNHTEDDILNYLNEYDLHVKKVYKISKNVESAIIKNDFFEFKNNLKKLISENALLESYEYLIGSLGQALFAQIGENTKKKIENWRNDETNSFFPIYDLIFKYLGNYFNMNLDSKTLRMYIHVQEVLDLCQGKLKTETLLKRIDTRIKTGFVLLNLHNKAYHNRVMTDLRMIKTVKCRFDALQSGIIEKFDSSCIKGQATFKSGKKITGKCVVIKGDLKDSKIAIKGKIVVCKVTTARDAGSLKDVKALIVDNGGILCHSAIFSREFHIPCLMGCSLATEYFKTGDLIEIDLIKELAKKIK